MATMQERRAAYRKAKEKARRKDESAIEHMRWHVGMGVLAEFPNAELNWHAYDDHPSRVLGVQVRLGEYGVVAYLSRQHLSQPDMALSYMIAQINEELSKGPIRHLFAE